MPGFPTYDSIINALTTGKGQRRDFNKLSAGAVAAGSSQDLWTAGGNPSGGTIASVLGTGVAKQAGDAGALSFTNSAAPATLHALSLGAGSTAALGTLMLYDRLVEYPFDSTVTTLTTFTQPGSIPSRDANGTALGAGVQIMVAKRLAVAVTAQTLTLTYINSEGTAGKTSAATLRVGEALIGNLANPTGMPFFWPLAAGDTGVRSITSAQMAVSAGAGSGLCATLIRPIAALPVMASASYVERDLVMQLASLPRIYDNSALGLAVLCNTTTTPVFGALQAAEN